MNFIIRQKKVISVLLITLSGVLFIYFLKDFCISAYSCENSLEYDLIEQADNNEKELPTGQKKPLEKNTVKSDVKTVKSSTKTVKPVKTEVKQKPQSKSENITRKNYRDGMITISIPKIKVRAGVVNGTSKSALKKGPGLYENSPLPDAKNVNVCIAAHRNAYGQWFRNVDKLSAGDEISLTLGKTKYIYKVEKVFIVENNNWSITDSTGYSAITLTSCYPLKPPYKRIVIRGKLVKKMNISSK